MSTMIKKLSVKAVCGDVKKFVRDNLSDETPSVACMRVVGIAHGMQTGSTDNGDWTAFKGGFEATNLISGETFAAGKLFLPEVAEDLVLTALSGDDVESVNLAFDIGVKINESSVTGYEYFATPLIKPSENDPLAQLKASLDLPALPSAEKVEDTQHDTEKTKKK